STDGRGESSAQLVAYDPVSDKAISRGLVLNQLKQNSLYQDRMGQAKIHSRLIQGSDGYLYFASMDEDGEAADGSVDPTWGSWMWRTRVSDDLWEPLFHVPKAIVAVAGYGSDIFALG